MTCVSLDLKFHGFEFQFSLGFEYFEIENQWVLTSIPPIRVATPHDLHLHLIQRRMIFMGGVGRDGNNTNRWSWRAT